MSLLSWSALPLHYKIAKAVGAVGIIATIGCLVYAGAAKLPVTFAMMCVGCAAAALFGVALAVTPEDKETVTRINVALTEAMKKAGVLQAKAEELVVERDALKKENAALQTTAAATAADVAKLQEQMAALISSHQAALKPVPAPATEPVPAKAQTPPVVVMKGTGTVKDSAPQAAVP